jgi:hypothetical protein
MRRGLNPAGSILVEQDEIQKRILTEEGDQETIVTEQGEASKPITSDKGDASEPITGDKGDALESKGEKSGSEENVPYQAKLLPKHPLQLETDKKIDAAKKLIPEINTLEEYLSFVEKLAGDKKKNNYLIGALFERDDLDEFLSKATKTKTIDGDLQRELLIKRLVRRYDGKKEQKECNAGPPTKIDRQIEEKRIE